MTAAVCPADSSQLIKTVNFYAYTHLTPLIVLVGVIGDVLTIYILSQPVSGIGGMLKLYSQILRKASVIYMYLTHLAITDLITLLSVLPMGMFIAEIRVNSFIT